MASLPMQCFHICLLQPLIFLCSVPSDWSLASIIAEGEGKFKLEERNGSNSVKSSTLVETSLVCSPVHNLAMAHPSDYQGETIPTLVCSVLLPLAYKINPDLVLLRCFPLICLFTSFLVQQPIKMFETWVWRQENFCRIQISILKQAARLTCHLQRGWKLLGDQMIINITDSLNIPLISSRSSQSIWKWTLSTAIITS